MAVYLEEGRRATLLREALNFAITKCLNVPKYRQLASALPKVHKKHPDRLRHIYGQLMQQLAHNIGEELDQMFDEENIVQLCNDLDDIINAAAVATTTTADTCTSAVTSLQPTWRPSGDATDDLRDHVAASKEQQRSRLQRELAEVAAENERLERQLVDLQGQLVSMRDLATATAHDLSEVADMVESRMDLVIEGIKLQ